MNAKIAVIPGDGIGPEIIEAALEVLKTATDQTDINLVLETGFAGGVALERFGEPLPEETIRLVRQSDAVLLGAVGDPRWDHVPRDQRPEIAILGLRKALGLYANIRPIRVSDALADLSPLKAEYVEGVDILIVRELNGGVYYGPKGEEVVNETVRAWDIEQYTEPEIERITQMAFRAAAGRRKSVISVDKANVLATSRLWRRTTERIATEFPAISLHHLYVDNCAMQFILAPRQFDVVVTSNMFGDILSDEAAVLTGSIGLLPSASIGEGPGLYEPIHGSAPDLAGKGVANPIGTILSTAMMLRYSLGNEGAAKTIEEAVDAVLLEGYRTLDIYRTGMNKVSTVEMGRLIAKKIKQRI